MCLLGFSDSVTLMSAAADLVRNIEPDRLLPPSGKLKREVSMEEIIQVSPFLIPLLLSLLDWRPERVC